MFMKKFTALMAAATLLFGGVSASAQVTVHTIGDSTMANYDENTTVTRGWAQYLDQYVVDMLVNNRAKSGSSTRSFYEGAQYWPSVKKQMKPGDIVVISFAHNDEKCGGVDGVELQNWHKSQGNDSYTETRGTNPSTTYRELLRKYVQETRDAGCTPILCGPICRMYFSGNTIRRNGRHDLGDSFDVLTETGVKSGQKVPADDHSMDYPYQMKLVAEEMNVPYVDLTTATAELYLSYGDADCHSILGDGDGSTHLSATGAALIARRFAQLCKDAGLLEGHINLTSDLSVTPTNSDMGKAYVGQQLVKEFMVSGFDLQPAAGNVTVSAQGALEVSKDRTNWSKSVELAYAGGTLIERFYARLTVTAPGDYNETIKIAGGGKETVIPVTAQGVELGGGTEVTAYWRLEKDDSYTLEGPAIVQPETWEGMYVQRYANPNANTVWPASTGFTADRKTQRNLLIGDEWPAGEEDEVPTRYIDFGITATEGSVINIDEISYYVCGCGGNGMCLKVYYFIGDDGAPVNIFEMKSMPANNMQDGRVTPVIALEEGKTLHLRFYPWYNGKATGKTLCISDVRFHGYAEAIGASISNVAVDAEAAVEYFNLQGIKVDNPAAGALYIKRTTMADNSIKAEKVIF